MMAFCRSGTLEGTATNALVGDLGEGALDEVEPRRRCRREVELNPRMPVEPGFDLGRLVSGVVVEHQVQVETGERLAMSITQ